MMEILQFILSIGVIYQVTSIISESSFPLFKWLRSIGQEKVDWPKYDIKLDWSDKLEIMIGELFRCFLCVSVWIGCIGSYFLFDFAIFVGYNQLSWLISGLFYSFICWFIHLIEGKMT